MVLMKKHTQGVTGSDFLNHIPFSQGNTPFYGKTPFHKRGIVFNTFARTFSWRELRSLGENIPIQSRQSPSL